MTEIRTIKVEQIGQTHAVFFTREFSESWGYMGMRDYATFESTDVYGVMVVPYSKYTHTANNSDAGLKKGSFIADGFGKDMANRIWWNVTHGIGYETLRGALKEYIRKEA